MPKNQAVTGDNYNPIHSKCQYEIIINIIMNTSTLAVSLSIMASLAITYLDCVDDKPAKFDGVGAWYRYI